MTPWGWTSVPISGPKPPPTSPPSAAAATKSGKPLQRHGIEREVFALPLASNAREFLVGRDASAKLSRPTAAVISEAALARWIRPRAARAPGYRSFRREDLLEDLLRAGGPTLSGRET